MDFSNHWKRFLSETPEIQGGAFISADGVLISAAAFGSPEHSDIYAAYCASFVAIAHQLFQDAGRGECEAIILECEHGYIVLMPVLDKTVFAVLARKQTPIGLIILDMLHALHDGPFGPGLAAEPILPPHSPKRGSAYARPE
jgi:predicted regulator of Ras-like GTPase activity (Roadblock/LC7/MglB family)